MAPLNLSGLNVVHNDPPAALSDSQDLLGGADYPGIADQLALWTNLNFQSDEPVISSKDRERAKQLSLSREQEEDEEEEEVRPHRAGNYTGPSAGHPAINQSLANGAPPSNYDLQQLLAGFGVDSFQYGFQQQENTGQSSVPSLAQLLTAQSPGTAYSGPASALSSTAASSSATSPTATGTTDSHQASKRARSRKSSIISSPDSPDVDGDSVTTPLNAAEDKRRRNTAASARFRLKKKEREANLEKRAKELEVKVTELERECEGLRRENGWLKGLVVGVTGGAAPQSQPPQLSSGIKRPREESN